VEKHRGERISTGNSKLDGLLEGGFLRNSMILLAGNPGAGKTLLSAKFIYEGAVKDGEPGVYACFAETRERFIQNIKMFGMDFDSLTSKGMVSILDLSIGTESEVQSALNQIFEAIMNLRARRLVVDSITAMSMGLKSEFEKRHLIRLLYRLIQKTGCTTITITDIPWGSQRIGESIEEFVADGILLMENRYDNDGVLKRHLRILKMRGTNHAKRTYRYVINERGVEIKA
jgi:circadian clock protein KaiC